MSSKPNPADSSGQDSSTAVPALVERIDGTPYRDKPIGGRSSGDTRVYGGGNTPHGAGGRVRRSPQGHGHR